MKRKRRTRCLLVTPATRYGSWAWLEKVIDSAGESVEWTIVSYGRPAVKRTNVRVLALPSTNYPVLGNLLARRAWWFLNLLYYLPLGLIAWVAALRRRHSILLANGIMAALILLPLRVTGARLIVAFHGSIQHVGPFIRAVLRFLLARCDAALVNSSASREDLSAIINQGKITVVPHPADEVFFQTPLSRPARTRPVVLYVGRMDEEKFAQCLRVCGRLVAERIIELWAAGGGALDSQLAGPGFRSLGYIHDRTELAAVYAAADIVWAPADTTYLSLPGVEALASGCPVIVSDVPAVWSHAAAGKRVPRDLIPSDVGFVVAGTDDSEAIGVVREVAREGIADSMREACRRYAQCHHGSRNIDRATRLLLGIPSDRR